MKTEPGPDDEKELARLLERQRRLSFDLDRDLPWELGVDLSRGLVPLDHDALVFPGASPEQRLALSQYLGLVIAQTFGEMETALVQARERVWERALRLYPVNPEFEAFGLQFFEEEAKHSRMFRRYLAAFAAETGIEPEDLQRLLPAVSGSLLHRTLKLNAELGGFALWWVLTLVEEISILIYKQLQPFRGSIDPLYHAIHRRHFEEEVRHSPYACWMIEHLHRHSRAPAALMFCKTDAMLAQALEIQWTLSSLTRLANAARLRRKHPFYATLSSCMPLVLRQSPVSVLRKLFVSAPFVSLLLNPNTCRDYRTLVARLRAVKLPTPKPRPPALSPP